MRGDGFDGQPGAAAGRTISWACGQAALWGGVALALYLAVGYGTALLAPPSPKPMPARATAAAKAVGAAPAAAGNSLVYRADRQGHVTLDAAVNGAPVRFLLDTGATFVALAPRDAAAAGIARHQLSFSGQAQTANGPVRVAPVTLREIRLQQMSVYDVPAAVIENLDVSLLGMSFLKRLRSYEMRDGALTITW